MRADRLRGVQPQPDAAGFKALNAPVGAAGPNKIRVKFGNDFRTSTSCDRNLAIDYVDVVS